MARSSVEDVKTLQPTKWSIVMTVMSASRVLTTTVVFSINASAANKSMLSISFSSV